MSPPPATVRAKRHLEAEERRRMARIEAALRACLEVDHRWRTEPSSAELDLLHENTFAAGWAALEGR